MKKSSAPWALSTSSGTPIPVADLRQPGDVGEPAEVVRAGDIHPGIVPAGGKGGLYLGRGHRRREAVRGQVLGKPHRPQVQQGHRLDGGGVGVAAEQELPAQRAHQRQHGLDTQGAAPGGEEGAAGAVEGGAAGLGFGDGAAGLKEAVRPATRYLRVSQGVTGVRKPQSRPLCPGV